MSKLYDNSFKIGVAFNILLFTVFNIYSYWANYLDHQEYLTRSIGMSGRFGFINWGFPFKWNETYFRYTGEGVVFNGLVIAFCGFLLGFMFKFIWSKIASQKSNQ